MSGPGDPYEAAYFDTLYHTANGQTRADRIRDRMVARLVRRFASTSPSPSLLEIGCGYGYLLERLRAEYRVSGMDFSAHAIAECRPRLGDAPLAAGDVQEAIPFDGPFHAVVAVNVLEHLRRPEAAIANILGALAPGGIAVVHLPTIEGALTRFIYSLSYAGDPTHVWRPSASQVRDVFASVGLSLVWESRAPHVPRALWNAVPVHPAYLAVYRKGGSAGRPVPSTRPPAP